MGLTSSTDDTPHAKNQSQVNVRGHKSTSMKHKVDYSVKITQTLTSVHIYDDYDQSTSKNSMDIIEQEIITHCLSMECIIDTSTDESIESMNTFVKQLREPMNDILEQLSIEPMNDIVEQSSMKPINDIVELSSMEPVTDVVEKLWEPMNDTLEHQSIKHTIDTLKHQIINTSPNIPITEHLNKEPITDTVENMEPNTNISGQIIANTSRYKDLVIQTIGKPNNKISTKIIIGNNIHPNNAMSIANKSNSDHSHSLSINQFIFERYKYIAIN